MGVCARVCVCTSNFVRVHILYCDCNAVLIITVGHRPFPVQFAHAAGQFHFLSDKMAERKRSVGTSASPSASKQLKRQVTVSTCEKWQRELDLDYQTLLWL